PPRPHTITLTPTQKLLQRSRLPRHNNRRRTIHSPHTQPPRPRLQPALYLLNRQRHTHHPTTTRQHLPQQLATQHRHTRSHPHPPRHTAAPTPTTSPPTTPAPPPTPPHTSPTPPTPAPPPRSPPPPRSSAGPPPPPRPPPTPRQSPNPSNTRSHARNESLNT